MTSVGNETEQKYMQQFEDRLREILDSGPENNPQGSAQKAQKSPVRISPHFEKKFSPAAEIVIRILAALIVVGLLVCFGIQIASR